MKKPHRVEITLSETELFIDSCNMGSYWELGRVLNTALIIITENFKNGERFEKNLRYYKNDTKSQDVNP